MSSSSFCIGCMQVPVVTYATAHALLLLLCRASGITPHPVYHVKGWPEPYIYIYNYIYGQEDLYA